MRKKYIVLCCAVLISIAGVSTMIASSQEIKESVSEEEPYAENFEETFAPCLSPETLPYYEPTEKYGESVDVQCMPPNSTMFHNLSVSE